MIDKKYIELMNQDIDNVINPKEKKDLQTFLSENPEAKEYYDEMHTLNRIMAGVPEPSVPENLDKRILNSLDFSKYEHKPEKKNAFGFGKSFNFRYAYTFAAGLAAGILIFLVFSITSEKITNNDLSGTIGIENTITLKEIPINLAEIQGNISLKEKNDLYFFEISLNSAALVDLTISYPHQLKLENFKPGIPGRFSFVTAGNVIKASNSGSQQYTFSFAENGANPSPVHIELSKYGKKVFEREFALSR